LPTVSASALVAASAEEVFEFIADYRNIPRLQPHFVTAKLVGNVERQVGAEVNLEGRFHGMPMRVCNRIVAYDPPLRMVNVSEGTVLSRSTWELQEVSNDPPTTRVTLTVDYKLGGALGGLFMGMGSALWPLFNRELQGMTNESLRRLGGFFDSKTEKA
jgi:ribosome-associated toxin RatA of RatAB toxin-antitoxin module